MSEREVAERESCGRGGVFSLHYSIFLPVVCVSSGERVHRHSPGEEGSKEEWKVRRK